MLPHGIDGISDKGSTALRPLAPSSRDKPVHELAHERRARVRGGREGRALRWLVHERCLAHLAPALLLVLNDGRERPNELKIEIRIRKRSAHELTAVCNVGGENIEFKFARGRVRRDVLAPTRRRMH